MYSWKCLITCEHLFPCKHGEAWMSKQMFFKKLYLISISDSLTIYSVFACIKYLLRSYWWLKYIISSFLGCIYSSRWSFQFQSDFISICYWGRSLYWYVKSGWCRIFESRLYSNSIPSQISHVSAGKSFICMTCADFFNYASLLAISV